MQFASHSVRIGDDRLPFGEMPLAPEVMTGRSQSELAHELAHDMVEHLRTARPASGADALRTLRNAFPHSSLGVRVAALAAAVLI